MTVEEPWGGELSRAQRGRLIGGVAARVVAVSSVLLVVYFLVPYRRLDECGPLIGLALGGRENR